jgi:YbbR domain-containing protein
MKSVRGRRLLRLITDNFGWKVFSVFAAAFLWFAVIDEPELVTVLSAPVEFKNKPADLEMGSTMLDRVQLEVRGPRSQLTDAAATRLVLVLDFAPRGETPRAGERTFTITQDLVNLPDRVTLERAIPSQVRVTLERRVRRDVPVMLRFADPAPEGYRVAHAEFTPERVPVVGPEGRVRELEAVRTEAIDLEAMKASAGTAREVMLNPYLADPLVSLASPVRIRARILLEKVESK